MINALASNDKLFADAGIATTFAFASPANKVNTGPIDKLTQMVNTMFTGSWSTTTLADYGICNSRV
ncbi:MAG: hypothetical protein GY802_12825 [Gammaproteobacteria bacterium]|nr:hypothetical protein [Gammaproteobacteria bacterium]